MSEDSVELERISAELSNLPIVDQDKYLHLELIGLLLKMNKTLEEILLQLKNSEPYDPQYDVDVDVTYTKRPDSTGNIGGDF